MPRVPPEPTLRVPTLRVSVCMPARNEEATVGAIVASIVEELVERHHVVDEVVVVDDGSTDATAAVAADAGAVVVSASSVLPECGPGTGKGEALWKSLYVATGDVLVFCDADLTDFDPAFVTGLLGPLLLDPTGRPDVGFVKGHYDRPVGGGRVTELMARPALGLFFPELLRIRQPLGGEFAARRAVLEQVPFVQGYGVDLGLLVDVAARFGPESIAQIDLGTRTHRNRGLDELGQQATAVLRVALRRAGVPDRPGWGEADVAERPPIVEVEAYRARRSATTAATQSTVAL
ncbi:MAG: glucosyl-3-phosphoglycerate synthase [Actinomycetota bacterium]|nr:glucosyl-3-phosphoglycerate synthase [Actinomycetota bacterium]